MTGRFALYWAPEPGEDLWTAGSTWLGRDAGTGADLTQPPMAGLAPERIAAITHHPRAYGFHATLTAPFILADTVSEGALIAAVDAFAAGRETFTAPLQVMDGHGILAIVEAAPSPQIRQLHADVLAAFQPFVAPLTPADRERRLKARLTPRQRDHLDRWGYPYVLEDFTFHLTLAEGADADERARLLPDLRSFFAQPLSRPLAMDGLCVFAQRTRLDPFRILHRAPFTGS